MKQYYLKFEPLSKMFYVEDSVIEQFNSEEEIPELELSADDYNRLGVQVPAEDAPVIGFLSGRSGDCYSADWNYMLAIAKTGARIVCLDYQHYLTQLNKCQGLVLPGGAFPSSELYYTDPRNDEEFASQQQKAYSLCIRYAVERKMPILGVCAGAQVVAAEFGLKLYRSFDYVETPIVHNTKQEQAHRLNVFPHTPLAQIFGEGNLFFVNSRHSELLVPTIVQRELWAQAHHCSPDDVQLPLEIYAEAGDGTPEAWGSVERNILCVQWHPEDLAAKGDARMQSIYQWLTDRVRTLA